MVLHVAVTGSDLADGSAESPLRTINKAAALARPGDVVQVHAGTYREWVKPVRGGLSDSRRITFEAAPGEHVVIKGSEVVDTWVHEEGTVWRAEVPNSLFGDFNPYVERVRGDWVIPPASGITPHLGEVYLNGKSFFEVFSRAEVDAPVRRTYSFDHWRGVEVEMPDPDWTDRVWYCEVSDDVTTIWANFQGADPNVELVEINVRPAVFYPERTHLDYITVRGFELAHAASPWTPPTADQPALIGPHWAKGWIIEDNRIHDAKCSAISLGKEITTGHNFASERGDKPGYQYQLETVFTAAAFGWDKEHIGSHVVRRNEIYDCGQNGIVGHLGCVFSTIEDNHIHDIGTKREFYGYEIGGIKFHAPIDVQIVHNRIHDTTLGIWLDWQVQGTRVSRNLLYRNTRDLFIEVSHGPCTVDHNVLTSPVAIELFSQGNAFINNLVLGAVRVQRVLDRATPYHAPQSTDLAGVAFVHGGDDRYVGNLFVGAPGGAFDARVAVPVPEPGAEIETYGTHAYDGSPASFEEYVASTGENDGIADHGRFHEQRQAVYVWSNVYAGGARPFDREKNAVHLAEDVRLTVEDDGGAVYLAGHVPAALTTPLVGVVTGEDLARVRIVGAEFSAPDGTLVRAGTDIPGETKRDGASYPAGPLAALPAGDVRVRVW